MAAFRLLLFVRRNLSYQVRFCNLLLPCQPGQMRLLQEKLPQRPHRGAPEHLAPANVFSVQHAALTANNRLVFQCCMFPDPNLPSDDTTPHPPLNYPEIPVWDAMTVCSPTSTLCAIWIRLSSFVPRRIIVVSSEPRSMQVFAPISTSSSMTTFPTCGNFTWAFAVLHETKSVSADDCTRMDDHAISDLDVRHR